MDVSRDAVAGVPAGSMFEFGGSTAPAGYLICNGSLVSRTTYARLFDAIGVTWGPGDGSTTFAIPDTRGRVPVCSGPGSGLTSRTLAALGGEENHQLTTAELASHSHTNSASSGTQSANHTHTEYTSNQSNNGSAGVQFTTSPNGGGNVATSQTTSTESATHTHTITVTVNSSGSDTAHNNMQPYYVVTKKPLVVIFKEEIMDEVRKGILEIKGEVKEINNCLNSIDKTLVKQQVLLDEHIRRTEILELKLEPVEKHVAALNGGLKALGVLSLVVGIFAAILKIFKP